MSKFLKLFAVVLRMFDGNTNTTNDSGLSNEMKTYYSGYLIDNADPDLVHGQFGQKHPIPKNGGKRIEFRKYDPFPKALTPLTEGVTPNGRKLNTTVITAEVHQYGDFTELSDMLLLTAIDDNLVEATALLGSQAGRTLDTITREVLNGGTNVRYSGGKSARSSLVGGEESGNDYLTVDDIRKAVRDLKVMSAKKFDGWFAGIIHTDTAFDLVHDKLWESAKTYCDPEDMYKGELGRIAGVRFVETSEAKVFHAEDLTTEERNLTVKTAANGEKTVSVKETISEADAIALAGRLVLIGGKLCEVESATAGATGSLTLKETVTAAENTVVYPGEAGAKGRDVYSTLIIGQNAYGETEITGGGLEHIVKQLGSAGTADPLNQRATAGWKATHAAVRLVEGFMSRIESASTFEVGAN